MDADPGIARSICIDVRHARRGRPAARLSLLYPTAHLATCSLGSKMDDVSASGLTMGDTAVSAERFVLAELRSPPRILLRYPGR